MPFREESCRSSCIYSGPLHSYSRDSVSQHPSTRAGAESIQLIYSGRALQALSDLARQFRCHPIFWRESPLLTGVLLTHVFQSRLLLIHLLLTWLLHPPCGPTRASECWLREGVARSKSKARTKCPPLISVVE